MTSSANGSPVDVLTASPRRRGPTSTFIALALSAGLLGGSVGLASPAAAGIETVRAADSYSRAVSGGWGTADTGAAWQVNDGSRFSVSGGVGMVALTKDGQTKWALLPQIAIDNEITTTISTARVPGGSGLYVSVSPRRIDRVGQYQAVVRFMPNGTTDLVLKRMNANWAETGLTREITVPGVRGDGGKGVRVRVAVTGTNPTTISAKVWQAGQSEPAGWMQTATDRTGDFQAPGAVSLYNYLSTGSAPLTVRFDDVATASTVFTPDAPQPTPAPSPTPTTPAPGSTTPAPNPTTPPSATPAPSPTTPPVVDVPPALEPPPATTPGTMTPTPPGISGDPTGSNPGGQRTVRLTDTAGSAPIGTARYAVPSNAYFVAPSGSDTNTGTVTAPFKTVTQAVKKAPAGATIVLRQGAYHESVTIPTSKQLHLLPYPGETVWFDGSTLVSDWVSDAGDWRADGWTAEFDSSPTYTKGAQDGAQYGWKFLNPAFPMAAHPDMVFIDGVSQKQVQTREQVVPGTFYVDYAADRIYVGSDPAGHQVRASDLSRALLIQGVGSTVRGIGFHRYATSVPTKGTVISAARDVIIEHVIVSDNATQGLYVGGRGLGEDNTIRHVTAARNGMLGFESSYSDGLVMDRVRAVGNNTERFNNSPVSGGFKIGRARDITVKDSVFSDNYSTGLWFDESVYNATVTGNDVQRNTGNGISYEISSKALIADNLITGNSATGLKVNNASDMDIWNNTILDNTGRSVWLVQDSRVASNLSTPGHDPRQSLPDPTVTWLLGPVTFNNNVVGGATTANCLLCVEDSALNRTDKQIGVSTDGNVYHRPSATTPRWTAVWATGAKNPQVYTTVAAFRTATGQEAHSVEFTGAKVWEPAYKPLASVTGSAASVAQPLSDGAGAATGYDAGMRHIGAWLN